MAGGGYSEGSCPDASAQACGPCDYFCISSVLGIVEYHRQAESAVYTVYESRVPGHCVLSGAWWFSTGLKGCLLVYFEFTGNHRAMSVHSLQSLQLPVFPVPRGEYRQTDHVG